MNQLMGRGKRINIPEGIFSLLPCNGVQRGVTQCVTNPLPDVLAMPERISG